MSLPSGSVKLSVPSKVGGNPGSTLVQVVTGKPGVSPVPQQIIQRTPAVAFKPIQIRQAGAPNSPHMYLNTNTALQYSAPLKRKLDSEPPSGYTKLSSSQMQLLTNQVSMSMPPSLSSQTTQSSMMMQPGAGIPGAPGSVNVPGGPNNSRKPCNCTKSHCLKLYCECFAQGQLCQNCNCNNCMNNLAYEDERARAIKMTLDRNPVAFHPKIGRGEGERKHTKGCNCKKSGCLKNYCECYEAKISCSDLCRCQGCRNTEDSIERRSLMRLAAMGSLKTRQPSSLKKHLVPHPTDTLPHVFITWEVAEAACGCMLAQADDAERRDILPAQQERIILEEFGRCLSQIIESASKAQPRSSGGVLLGNIPGAGSSESVAGHDHGGHSDASSTGDADDHHSLPGRRHHSSHHHMSHLVSSGHHSLSRADALNV